MGLVLELRRDLTRQGLADQPSEFQDYVVVHELLHLRIPNHGRLFTVAMRVHLPGSSREGVVKTSS